MRLEDRSVGGLPSPEGGLRQGVTGLVRDRGKVPPALDPRQAEPNAPGMQPLQEWRCRDLRSEGPEDHRDAGRLDLVEPEPLLVLDPCAEALRGPASEFFLAAVARVDPSVRLRAFVVGGEVFAENRGREEALRREMARLGLGARVTFAGVVDDMPAVMGRADLVVSRAGVGTIAEVTAVGLPMVLVPGTFGGGHQEENASAMVGAGAAVSIGDAQLTPESLLAAIDGLTPERLKAMAKASAAAGRRDAAQRVLGVLKEVVGQG